MARRNTARSTSVIAHARRDRRRRRREPARGARRGCRRASGLLTVQDRLRRCRVEVQRPRARGAPTTRQLRATVRALRVQELAARRGARRDEPTPGPRSPSARRADDAAPLRHRSTARRDRGAARCAERTTSRARRGDVRALARRDRARRARRRFDTETTSLDPMQARDRRPVVRDRAGHACYMPLAHRYAGRAGAARPRATCSRDSKPWLADADARRSSARTSSTTSTCSPTTASRSRGVAHDTLLESYVLESHQPHDMDSLAWRHLGVKTHHLRRRDRQGRQADSVRPGRDRRATEYAAEDADITLQLHRRAVSARSTPTPKLDFVYRDDRDAGARRAVPHGAQRRADRRGAARRAEPRARRARCMALEQQAYQLAGAAVQPGLAEAARRDPVRQA